MAHNLNQENEYNQENGIDYNNFNNQLKESITDLSGYLENEPTKNNNNNYISNLEQFIENILYLFKSYDFSNNLDKQNRGRRRNSSFTRNDSYTEYYKIYNNICEESYKNKYKKYLNNVKKDKTSNYVILTDYINVYSHITNGNSHNFLNNNNIINRRTIFGFQFILNFILYLVKNNFYKNYHEFFKELLITGCENGNLYNIHYFLNYFRFNEDLITFVEKIHNSERFSYNLRIEFNQQLNVFKNSFPIKILSIDNKLRNFIVIKEYFKIEEIDPSGHQLWHEMEIFGYKMKEKLDFEKTKETYQKFKYLKLNHQIFKGIYENYDKKETKEFVKMLMEKLNLVSNNKSLYNNNISYDYSLDSIVNNLFTDFLEDMAYFPTFGNEYQKTKKSFNSKVETNKKEDLKTKSNSKNKKNSK